MYILAFELQMIEKMFNVSILHLNVSVTAHRRTPKSYLMFTKNIYQYELKLKSLNSISGAV